MGEDLNYGLDSVAKAAITDKVQTIGDLTRDFERHHNDVRGLLTVCSQLENEFRKAVGMYEVIQLQTQLTTVEIDLESMKNPISDLKQSLLDAIDTFSLKGQDKQNLESQIKAYDSLINRLTRAINRIKEARNEAKKRVGLDDADVTNIDV